MLAGLGAEIGDIDVALVVACDRNDVHARDHRAGGVGSVRGDWNEADVSFAFVA